MELLERGSLLLELSRLFGEAAAGQGRLVFLAGEAGIGKTVLVRRFGELIRERTSLLVGNCDPVSTPGPLGPLLDIADRLAGPSIRLSEGKDRLFRDVLAALAAAPSTPVLVFEDLHWADEATLDLLRFLARRIEDCGAMLIVTFRDDEVGDRHPLRLMLGDVATAPAVRRLTLSPLSLESVRALVLESGMDAGELFRHTGGNPFFVTEIVAAGGTWLPGTVRDAVLARAARLPPTARSALEAAAVLGARGESWLVEAVAGERATEGMDECLACGMLTARGDGYAFRHELVREAVLDTIAAHHRIELNRRALEALRAAGPPAAEPARLAHHAEAAGDAAAVIEYAPEAALRARALNAHREAAAQYARALRFSAQLAPAERAQLLEAFSYESAAIDRWDDAIGADLQLVALWREQGDRAREGWALTFLAGCLIFNGRNVEAEEASRASIGLLEALPPGPDLAEAYLLQSNLRTLNRDDAEAIEWARTALRLTNPGDDPRIHVLALTRLGAARLVGGDPGGEDDLLMSLSLAREAGLHWNAAGAYLNLGTGWSEMFELARAERYLLDGIEFATRHELEGILGHLVSRKALMELFLGRWSEAETSARTVMRRTSGSAISRIMAMIALGRLKARQGDPAAGEILDELLELVLPTGTLQRIGPVRIARAEAAWLAGDADRVRAEALAGLELALPRRLPWIAGELLFWLAQAGEPVRAPDWLARPFALQLAGGWAEAAEEWRRLGCPYEAAQAGARTGDPGALSDALAEFERLGAVPAAHHLRRRMREQGIRGISRGPRPSTRANHAGLTRRELEIATLLCEGLRNTDIAARLFVSPKTVDHHVSRVLAKLGVHTRGEAAREVTRLGLVQHGEAGARK